MTSFWSQTGQLSNETMHTWERQRRGPRPSTSGVTTEQRRDFYMEYLYDVVPDGVGVHLVTHDLQPWDLSGPTAQREEIQLRYGSQIFMTGIVGIDRNPEYSEQLATTVAFSHWRQGLFHLFRRQAWAIFTGLDRIMFCSSRNGQDWVRRDSFHPINDVREVVAYLQREFDEIRRQ